MLQKNRCAHPVNITQNPPKLNKPPPPLLLLWFGVCFECFCLLACGVAMHLHSLRFATRSIYGVDLFGFLCCCFVRLLVVALSYLQLLCFFCMQVVLINFVDFGCIRLFLCSVDCCCLSSLLLVCFLFAICSCFLCLLDLVACCCFCFVYIVSRWCGLLLGANYLPKFQTSPRKA